MRYPLAASLLAVAASCAGSARAQHCPPPVPGEPGQLGLVVDLSSQFATYRNARFEGEYQGLTLTVGWRAPWLGATLSMPAYRLTRNGPATHGVGDVMIDLRVPLARPADTGVESGVALAATLPTGDADRDLGMGHVMLMPGLWTTWSGERAFLSAQIGYGRALADTGSAHHAGTGAIVNPMNTSEIELALAGGVNVTEPFRTRAGVYGAVPVAAEGGQERAAAFAGVDVNITRWLTAGVEGHLPLAGSPFLSKIVATVGGRF